MRAVIDTNVIISALYYGGTPQSIIELIDERLVTPCYSDETWEELTRVLFRRKFSEVRNLLPFTVEQFLGRLQERSWFVSLPKPVENIIPHDPPDNYLLACAKAANVSFIISGNIHITRLGTFEHIPIRTPRQFLDTIKR